MNILKNLFKKVEYRVVSVNIMDDFWYEIEYTGIFGWTPYTEEDIDIQGFCHGSSARRFVTEERARLFIKSITKDGTRVVVG